METYLIWVGMVRGPQGLRGLIAGQISCWSLNYDPPVGGNCRGRPLDDRTGHNLAAVLFRLSHRNYAGVAGAA